MSVFLREAYEEITDDKTQMCSPRSASKATLTPCCRFSQWRVFGGSMWWKTTCSGYEDGKLRFPGRGSDVRSVELVVFSLFSNSRGFTAYFLQIVLHKQAWLTWYLRILNNSWFTAERKWVLQFCCQVVRVLLKLYCQNGFKSLTQENAAVDSTLVHFAMINGIFLTSENDHLEFAGQCGYFRGQALDVIFKESSFLAYVVFTILPFFCLFCCSVQVRLGLQLPGPLCVLNHPSSSGLLVLLSPYSGNQHNADGWNRHRSCWSVYC